jgi:hypothetical protein
MAAIFLKRCHFDFLTYNIVIVSIDYVDLDYIGIDTKRVSQSFFV